mgnify:CR=1 FL=1
MWGGKNASFKLPACRVTWAISEDGNPGKETELLTPPRPYRKFGGVTCKLVLDYQIYPLHSTNLDGDISGCCGAVGTVCVNPGIIMEWELHNFVTNQNQNAKLDDILNFEYVLYKRGRKIR